ncbi:MAG: EAL domain-containing protein [Magnetococcales bacterium]|nr:EAL domain-containing protein [Magnetococcales bacterium]MBF0156285.1 EAL domain-containing protein [Magnetococcales bacterium]
MPRTSGRRHQLISLTGLGGLMVLAALVGFLFKHLATSQLMRMGENNNVALSQVVANALWPEINRLIHSPASEWSERQFELNEAIRSHLFGLSVIKVKIYSLEGMTLFSTQADQVGQDQSHNPGILSARGGKVLSDLVFRKGAPSFDGEVEDRSLISSYIPLRHEGLGDIKAVFELYDDVSLLEEEASRTQWLVSLITLSALLVLYAILVVVVRHSDRRGRLFELRRERHLRQLQRQKDLLEKRVQQRTQELTAANLLLRTEVTVRRQAEMELCLAASVFQNTTEGIVVTDPDGRIQSVNPAFSEITGYPPEEAVGQSLCALKSANSSEEFCQEKWRLWTRTGKWRGELWGRRREGEPFNEWLTLTAVRDGDGQVIRYVGIFSDITEIKKSEEQVQFLAHYDPVTRLPNRTLLLDRLRNALGYASRFEQTVAVIHIGLDRLKLVQDSFGIEARDAILKKIGERLSASFRDEDSVAKLAGNDFSVLATGISDTQGVPKITAKVMDLVREPVLIQEERFFLGASVGVTLFPFDGTDPETLLRHSGTAMSRAREQGGNQVQFFTDQMGELSRRRLSLENALRTALENEEFTLYYQPQIDVNTGSLSGLEALIRWDSPRFGRVSPVNFIPVAEESDFIVELGEWVLRTACQQAVVWQEEGYAPIRMGVNVSARQFQRHDLSETVDRALADTGLSPAFLDLELTEGAFMKEVDKAVVTLETLKKKGLCLSIDDFGTGYSSLSYLKKFPIHTLKIDRAFVRDITTDPDDAAITRTIIAMAKGLGLKVIAEGVASVEQLEFLRTLGCDYVQGFLFSPPVPPDEVTFFLEEDRAFRSGLTHGAGSGTQRHILSAEGTAIVFPGVANRLGGAADRE